MLNPNKQHNIFYINSKRLNSSYHLFWLNQALSVFMVIHFTQWSLIMYYRYYFKIVKATAHHIFQWFEKLHLWSYGYKSTKLEEFLHSQNILQEMEIDHIHVYVRRGYTVILSTTVNIYSSILSNIALNGSKIQFYFPFLCSSLRLLHLACLSSNINYCFDLPHSRGGVTYFCADPVSDGVSICVPRPAPHPATFFLNAWYVINQ